MKDDPKEQGPMTHSHKNRCDQEDAAALLVPAMPPAATLRLLIPESCKWIARGVAGGVLIDATLAESVTDLLRARRGGVLMSCQYETMNVFGEPTKWVRHFAADGSDVHRD